jgi:hypothetical protein
VTPGVSNFFYSFASTDPRRADNVASMAWYPKSDYGDNVASMAWYRYNVASMAWYPKSDYGDNVASMAWYPKSDYGDNVASMAWYRYNVASMAWYPWIHPRQPDLRNQAARFCLLRRDEVGGPNQFRVR